MCEVGPSVSLIEEDTCFVSHVALHTCELVAAFGSQLLAPHLAHRPREPVHLWQRTFCITAQVSIEDQT